MPRPCSTGTLKSQHLFLHGACIFLTHSLLTFSSVDIKGNDDEPVVLCTLTKTYVVRNVDTTNANLLMPSSNGSLLPNGKRVRPDSDLFDNFRPVAARTSAHYELVHIAPRTENLAAVMLARAADGGRATGGYRMPELRNLVQASEEEIVSKLVELNAYFHDGETSATPPPRPCPTHTYAHGRYGC